MYGIPPPPLCTLNRVRILNVFSLCIVSKKSGRNKKGPYWLRRPVDCKSVRASALEGVTGTSTRITHWSLALLALLGFRLGYTWFTLYIDEAEVDASEVRMSFTQKNFCFFFISVNQVFTTSCKNVFTCSECSECVCYFYNYYFLYF